jgi:MIP family channel proteins
VGRKLAAETLGTFLLVFAGPGAIVIDTVSGGAVTPVGIGLSFGLAVMVAIYAFGPVSGAHINPAVTIALAASRRFPWRDAPLYVAAQIAGGIGASLFHLALFGNVAHLGASLPSDTALQAFGLEGILTLFLLVIVVAAVSDRLSAGWAPVAIGGYVGLAATFAGPIAGASMNPARSFGPALVSGAWSGHWAYWAGPLLGALAGAAIYTYLTSSRSVPEARGAS